MRVLKVIIGSVFVISAIAKYHYIDYFDYQTLQILYFLPAAVIPFLTRILISIELFIGALFIINKLTSLSLIITIILLIFFSFINIYQWANNQEDCGCFGQIWTLTPWQSLIKNIGLLIVNIGILRHEKKQISAPIKSKQKWIAGIGFIFLLVFSFILKPVYFSYNSKDFSQPYLFPSEKLNKYWNILNTSKKAPIIVGFVSTKCPHCQSALQAIDKLTTAIELPEIKLVVYGDSSEYELLLKKLQIKQPFEYMTETSDNFYDIVDNAVPKFFLLKNDTVYYRWKGEINFDDIDSFKSWKQYLTAKPKK